jgi:uncharacterized protein YkwD
MFCAAGTASACSRDTVSGANAVIDPRGGIDAALLDAAIRSELNYHRCKAGRSALSGNVGLRQVAGTHAKWMAKTATVSHQSGVAGQSTLKARMSTSGVKFRAGSENIGMVHRFRIDGQSFRIRDAGSCSFATQAGETIGAHSYGTLARHMVDLWMASSKHRKNILDPKVSMVGSAAGFNAKAPYCGQFFMSQNFAG